MGLIAHSQPAEFLVCRDSEQPVFMTQISVCTIVITLGVPLPSIAQLLPHLGGKLVQFICPSGNLGRNFASCTSVD